MPHAKAADVGLVALPCQHQFPPCPTPPQCSMLCCTLVRSTDSDTAGCVALKSEARGWETTVESPTGDNDPLSNENSIYVKL